MMCGVLLAAASVMNVHATHRIGETFNYTICPGDTVTLTTREVVVYADSILYDTLIMAGVPEPDSVFNQYVVNVHPRFLKQEFKELTQGESISWCDTVIDRAGTYERIYHSVHGCDSIYRIVVTERLYTPVETFIVDTLCQGSSMSFGGKTLTLPGVYRDTFHLSHYDSITVLTLNVIKPDTVITSVRIPEGQSWDWNGQTYEEAGTYYALPVPNRFGCDSLNALRLTTYQVDTIDTVVVICPNTTIIWHGMTKGQTGKYLFPGHRPNGDLEYYRLDLTVKELVYVDTLFRLCDEESLSFQGKTYVNAGEYTDVYTCDTTYRITIVKYPSQVYLQTGVLDALNPYYWNYILDGEPKTDIITAPGLYEHTSHNAETGCNDIYRLVLTRDETVYNYDTAAVVCESEYFEWRGKKNLNRQGIGQTTHY